MSIVVNNAYWPVIEWYNSKLAKLTVMLPVATMEPAERLVSRCKEKHGDYIHITMDTPRKPRSTGPGSQCSHLHGHLQQLAQALGLTMTEVKDFMKRDCPWWPSHEITIGKRTERVYMSESDVESATEAKAISWCHQAALDCGIILREE